MYPLPAVNVGLGKWDFHYLRAESLQMSIKDVQEVLHPGPGEAVKHDAEFSSGSNQGRVIIRVVDTRRFLYKYNVTSHGLEVSRIGQQCDKQTVMVHGDASCQTLVPDLVQQVYVTFKCEYVFLFCNT